MKFALITFGNEESYGLLFVGGELLEYHQEIKYFDGDDINVDDDILSWNPDFIMFSPMTTFYAQALEISRLLPKYTSVFGGHHAMSVPEEVLSDGVDIVVVGPVRGSIQQIVDGSVGIIRTTLTEPFDLAKPAREQYYSDIPRAAKRYRKFMISMLGCPWNCAYCSSSSGHMKSLFGKSAYKRYYLSRRPIKAVINEALEIIKYDTKEIEWVDDDIFAGDENWMLEFLPIWKSLIKLPMYVSATSFSVLKASDKLLASMQGVVNVIGLGIQAARESSLKLFNRNWDNEKQMKAAYNRLLSFGFKVNLQCIVGLPVSEPVEDALDTIKLMQRIGKGSICSCYPLMIYPKTKLEEYCSKSKIKLNSNCNGDTNSGIPSILFDSKTVKRLRNICKLATLFVKYNIDESWMRVLIDVDFSDEVSKRLSTVRYKDCVEERLKDNGEVIFDKLISTTNLRY